MSTIITLDHEDFVASVTEHSDGSATLRWTDGVCQDESEDFGDLAVALMRLALLDACGDRGFRHTDPEAFEREAIAFLRGALV